MLPSAPLISVIHQAMIACCKYIPYVYVATHDLGHLRCSIGKRNDDDEYCHIYTRARQQFPLADNRAPKHAQFSRSEPGFNPNITPGSAYTVLELSDALLPSPYAAFRQLKAHKMPAGAMSSHGRFIAHCLNPAILVLFALFLSLSSDGIVLINRQTSVQVTTRPEQLQLSIPRDSRPIKGAIMLLSPLEA